VEKKETKGPPYETRPHRFSEKKKNQLLTYTSDKLKKEGITNVSKNPPAGKQSKGPAPLHLPAKKKKADDLREGETQEGELSKINPHRVGGGRTSLGGPKGEKGVGGGGGGGGGAPCIHKGAALYEREKKKKKEWQTFLFEVNAGTQGNYVRDKKGKNPASNPRIAAGGRKASLIRGKRLTL